MFKDLNNKIEQLIEELGTDKLLSDEQIADQYNDFKCTHIEIEKSTVHKDWFNFTLELEFSDADHPDFSDYVIENGFYNRESDRWAFDNWYPAETMDQLIALVLKEIEKFEAPKNEDLNNTIKVIEIDWDTEDDEYKDDEDLDLPTELEIPEMDEDDIADYLSDEYGFCVNSFEIQESLKEEHKNYTHDIFKVEDQEFSITKFNYGRYDVKSIHPYDNTEYHWATSKNGVSWKIYIDTPGKLVDVLENTDDLELVAKRLLELDKEAGLIENIDK